MKVVSKSLNQNTASKGSNLNVASKSPNPRTFKQQLNVATTRLHNMRNILTQRSRIVTCSTRDKELNVFNDKGKNKVTGTQQPTEEQHITQPIMKSPGTRISRMTSKNWKRKRSQRNLPWNIWWFAPKGDEAKFNMSNMGKGEAAGMEEY
ncbi:hypothetical protein V6N13_048815 [Hibiscus sabdariffa]|uniref:Uncharacterized protein n=1 Tax=Hibiscus sabdariffa TaxID=183260 RepID=A0ABR2DII2_9ROSI